MSNWVVRKARHDDLNWLLEQTELFQNSIDAPVPFNKDYMTILIGEFIDNHYALIVTNDGVPYGFAAAMCHPHMFNPDFKIFTEVAWWVSEQHRNTRAGLILLDALEKVAEKEGADVIALSSEHNSPLALRAFTKRGYKALELKEYRWLHSQPYWQ
jgi:ribosomal protein S18 acetylase RimI-like enzyme